MTTTKKTTAAKKPAAPRSDYKANTRVTYAGRGGEATGRTTGEFKDTPTGRFIEVNVGDKKNPLMKWARPAQLRGF